MSRAEDVVRIFVDGKLAGRINVPKGADDCIIAKAALALPAAARAIRSQNVREAVRREDRYELFSGVREGVPLTSEEAARIPGAQFVPHPFQGL